jgi:arabinogalactan endo-1,4-beta-galactosidase
MKFNTHHISLGAAIFSALFIGVSGYAYDGISGASQQVNDSENKREFWLGADISGTTHDESRGWYSSNKSGKRTENTVLMKQLGLNAVRLRVWVNPRDGWSAKEDVLEMAKRAKKQGMAIMIDFHYSDWWADPGKQITPEAWKDYNYEQMCEALANHTEETLSLLKKNGIDVKWVQVGNETTNGFLWPMGKIDVWNPEDTGMEIYAGLTTAGYDAVKKIYPEAEVIVHLDNGFDSYLYNSVFDGLKQYGGKWDTIGMSIYPFWAIDGGKEPTAEKTLADAIINIRELNKKYGCDVMIVETGVEAAKPIEGNKFMTALLDSAYNATNGACTGVFYWAPECPAPEMSTIITENGDTVTAAIHGYQLGAFDSKGRPTAIMDAFTDFARKRK